MTSLLNIAGNIPVVEAGGQSLRFEDGDSAYLSWTPASAGNRKTWTYSTWIKRGNLGGTQLFGIGSGDSWMIRFSTSNKIACNFANDTVTNYFADSTRVFRDTSAWYHIVVSCDTTQSTASDRVKIYVNGELETITGGATTIPQNRDTDINVAAQHRIGAEIGNRYYSDGYLANVCFIDGQALDPTSFGEYDDTLWKPKSDANITNNLTFGTNGFYLPFKQTTEAEGFSAVTYTGTGTTHSIKGVGFSSSPDLVWIKDRTTGSSHRLHDSIRGAGIKLSTDTTAAEVNESSSFTSFDADGFSLAGSAGAYNTSGRNYVAWCWDAGSGSAVSNTDGSITSTVKANTAKGFSIGTVTTRSQADTIGHGLSQAPDMVIFKPRNGALSWGVYHSSFASANNYLFLEGTNSVGSSSAYWNSTAPTSTVFSIGGTWGTYDAVFYAFHSVSGYSSFGSYSGTGAAGNSITGLGFKPAFILVKRTDAANSWYLLDNTRNPTGDITQTLAADSSGAEGTQSTWMNLTADGFDIQTTSPAINASGGTYIYMAFADTRDATFFGDTSGNGNNWTPNALNNTDVVLDSPVSGGNFAVLSAVDRKSGGTLSEGNLGYNHNSNTYPIRSTFAVDSGKWYWEVRASGNGSEQGLALEAGNLYGTYVSYNFARISFYNGNKRIGSGSLTSYDTGGGATAGDVYGFAANLDSGDLTVYRNGTSLGSLHTWTPDGTYYTPHMDYSTTSSGVDIVNFGQDSSFAGTETPQGNTDDNGVGDFYYAPPSGFLCLKTSSLPAATITAPDEYFNTVLYTGTGATQSITGVGFQPDFTWVKNRSNAYHHGLFDNVRGANKVLKSSDTTAEVTYTEQLTSFDTDGFSLGDNSDSGNYVNISGHTYVGWNWLAGNGTVSNTSGSITSTVSANPAAGFSVVSYTGTGSAATVGHGLSSAPDLIIVKNRDTARNWTVYNSASGATKYLLLNTTNADQTGTSIWNDTAPTSSVFSVGTSQNVNFAENYIAYCFHSVEGYSKIGSYTGNGSSDGVFVHCGFRPAWVMIKRTDSTSTWVIQDAERNQYNVVDKWLAADSSTAEGTLGFFDFTSNGFKHRYTSGTWNTSGGSYIFLAFAEAPFKSANAR